MVTVLIGPPGVGKSSIGRAVAARLGAPFVDSDVLISQQYGPIPEIFLHDGEAEFRRKEERMVAQALADDDPDAIVALGGGAPLSATTQRLLAEHFVVFLDVDAAHVGDRIDGSLPSQADAGPGAGDQQTARPLLAGGIDAWQRLYDQRLDTYARLADHTVDTRDLDRESVADEVEQAIAQRRQMQQADETVTQGSGLEPRTVHVGGQHPYDVFIGENVLDRLAEAIDDRVTRVLIVHQPTGQALAERLRAQLDGRVQAMTAEVPDAEEGKRIEVIGFLWQVLGKADFTRTDLIIGVGGGAVTDIAGFAAATWLRGIKVIQVPTSVLGMADAAVGGKTGINTNEGKNLAGAFHTPAAVFADTTTLETLPRNELLTGYAEVAKCGFIGQNSILDLIEQHGDQAVDPASPVFLDALTQAVSLKADVVEGDLREAGRREILNYGHTLGHAIEYAERYQWRHGAAVSVGMVFAAHLSHLTGHLSDADLDRHYSVLQSLGLPTTYRRGAWEQLLAVMHRDKKARGDVLRFIILDGIGRPIVLTGPEPDLLFTAYQEIAE